MKAEDFAIECKKLVEEGLASFDPETRLPRFIARISKPDQRIGRFVAARAGFH